MNIEQAKRLLPVIIAFAEGKKIQRRMSALHSWEDVTHPVWLGHDYRIAPSSPGQVLLELFYPPNQPQVFVKWADTNQYHWNGVAEKFLAAMKDKT